MTSRIPARALGLAAVIATAITAAPAAASAATSTYDVTVKTTVDYKLHKAWGDGRNGGDRHLQFSSELSSRLSGVRFTDGVISPVINGAPVDESTVGFSSTEDRSETTPTRHLHCESDSERSNPWGRASLDATGPGRRTIALRVTDRLEYEGNCDDGRNPGYGIASIDGDAEDYDGPFDGVFELPLEAIGQGKIIQLVRSEPVDRETCPGHDELTTACAFSWEAEVTFVRSDDADLPMPIVTPMPTTNPASADTMVRHVTDAIRDYLDEQRIAASIAKAFRDGHTSASVRLDCPGACSGTVSAYAASTATSAPSGRPLATATFRALTGGSRLSAAADDARTMLARLRFDAADRRALAKRKFVALRFAMRTADDRRVRRATIVVRIRK